MAGPDSLEVVGQALRASSHVLIGSHVDPDGDAIGSCLGLAHALDRIGVLNTLVLSSGDAVPSTYAFLPGSDRFKSASAATGGDVFVALDSPALRRLGDAEQLARGAQTLVSIDHHPDAQPEGALNHFDSDAASTSVLIWRLLRHLNVQPDKDIATCLYTALLTDSGRFSYSNTTADTLHTAAAMVEAGAHPHEIYTAVYENRTAGSQQLVSRVLSRVVLANNGRVAYSWVTDEDFAEVGARPDEAENLIDYVRALGGIEIALLAKTDGGEVRASLRAKSDADVGAVARDFGGGGHRAAAGFTYQGDLEGLLLRLLPALPGGGR